MREYERKNKQIFDALAQTQTRYETCARLCNWQQISLGFGKNTANCVLIKNESERTAYARNGFSPGKHRLGG